MPTYSYVCTVCGHRFDAQQSFSDAALVECPECTGRLRKLFGNVGVVFKGSGFYRTDARAASNGTARTGTTPDGAPKTPAASPAAAGASSTSGAGSSDKASGSGSSTSTSSVAASA